MKIHLVANLSASGQVILAETPLSREVSPHVAGRGFAMAAKCGCVVLGATTHRMFADAIRTTLPDIDVVVLTHGDAGEGAFAARSVEDAISYLEGKGRTDACLLGGTAAYNAFLEAGAVDELSVGIMPEVTAGGGMLQGKAGVPEAFSLAEDPTVIDGTVVCRFVRE